MAIWWELATKSNRGLTCISDLIDPITAKVNYGCPPMGWRFDQARMSGLMSDNRVIWPKVRLKEGHESNRFSVI